VSSMSVMERAGKYMKIKEIGLVFVQNFP
jgi:hypothetical protein